MTMKKNIDWSFQPAQWLSSAEDEEDPLQLMKASVLAESSILYYFSLYLYTPAMSMNSSQVGVSLFLSL